MALADAKRTKSRSRAHGRAAGSSNGLGTYRKKRNFAVTSEPSGEDPHRSSQRKLQFVIQKHDASHLHYDFRLEWGGVLKSWAVPKGPSLDPDRKSLAIEVEDHPVEYGGFEGTIPEGQYGGGTVMLWDQGTWEPTGDAATGLETGKLRFTLHGSKLRGEWSLVRMRRRTGERKNSWLLMKIQDKYASKTRDILTDAAGSVTTGRSISQIAGDKDRVWNSKGHTPREPDHGAATSGEPWPTELVPQLAVLVDRPPEGEQWLHEIKFDGYRILAYLKDGGVTLMTRNNQNWTAKFPALAKELESWAEPSALLDGEVVLLDKNGHSDFQALQESLSEGDTSTAVYYVFDLLYFAGRDLRTQPLIERKQLLKDLLEKQNRSPMIRFSDHISGDGKSVMDKACAMSLEGIVSKRAEATYVSRRDATWVKSKCGHQQEMVVVGYTDPQGSRQEFGALLLGYYQKGKLIYGGRVGTGFDLPMLKEIMPQLRKLEQQDSPLDKEAPARERRAAHWLRPELVAEIRFSNWTRDGLLRQPAFVALRKDKDATEVVREIEKPAGMANRAVVRKPGAKVKAVSVASDKTKRMQYAATDPAVRLTHPDKVLYKEKGITKQDLADYYQLVATWLLPHVTGRPLTLLRHPGGVSSKGFFQRNWTEGLGAGVDRLSGINPEDSEIGVHDLTGVLSLVQMNVLEIHTWNFRAEDLTHPDQLVFDLDPGPDVPWKAVLEGAARLHEALERLKLPAFLKTSGGKGLHVTIPIKANVEWESAKAFCQQVAQALAQQSKVFIANMRKDLRRGKIYIDYQRNNQAATAVAPYSTRARPEAGVSMPITWEELPAIKSGDQFRLDSAAQYLSKRKDDPWADFEKSRVDLRRIAAGK